MTIVAVLSRKTGDPLPGASRIAVPILLMTTLRSLMETHLSSFGQDRTEENGVATFHLSQNGMYAINMEADGCVLTESQCLTRKRFDFNKPPYTGVLINQTQRFHRFYF